jgi:DNA-binding NtrC family response regulator
LSLRAARTGPPEPTGYGSIATAVESIKLGAASYLTKPADADQIVAAFEGTPPKDDVDVPSLARVEWEHIQRILTDCEGHVSKAARALGIHRRSLQRKLSKYPAARWLSLPAIRRSIRQDSVLASHRAEYARHGQHSSRHRR